MALAGTVVMSLLALALVALDLGALAAPGSSATPAGSGGAIASSFVVGEGPLEGRPAPGFTLSDVSGRQVSLADYRGRPVIVNFWASWCGPCKEEFPLLAAARARYASQGLEVLGIVYEDSSGSAAAFMASEGAAWPMLLDPDGVAAGAYGVHVVPESFYIDPTGVVRTLSFGPPPASGIDALIAQILPAAPSASPVASASAAP
ncbi:MAG TPA: TlpA disulfide reductase family protein [Candidatus Sulfotelmatobacter sp.]|nr:TlpA disulfide reductase family protein [Candidatus Sulfotelmatobacter sp.]